MDRYGKTGIGYEISFNKLRDLAEVVKEIRKLEAETGGLPRILNFSSAGH